MKLGNDGGGRGPPAVRFDNTLIFTENIYIRKDSLNLKIKKIEIRIAK